MTAEIELSRPRAAALPDKLRYAQALADSGLLPTQYRKQPANLLYAVEYGEMLGLPPMAAINGIHVIEGKPSASAALISALVRRAGHRLRVTGDDQRAVAEIVRADDPDFTFRSEWTITRAQSAGLANKAVWRNYPAAMLKARALTEVARDACQEALSGLQYTPEELGAQVSEDGEPIDAIVVPTPQPADPDWASKPATSHERTTDQPETPAAAPERDWDAEIALAVEVADADGLRALWRAAKAARPGDVELRERIAAASKDLVIPDSHPDPAPAADEPVDAEIVDELDTVEVEQKQHRHMHALWNKAEVSREERLAATSHLVGRPIESSSQLTAAEADVVIERLRAFDTVGVEALKNAVDRWLHEYITSQAAGASS